jgi:modulator of FtsH protease
MYNQDLSQTKPVFQTSFYSKVFFFFGMAILTTAVGSYIGLNYLASYFIANPLIMWGLFIVELILIFSAKLWKTTKPLNYLLFLAFAFISGLTLVPLLMLATLSSGSMDLIIKAFLATALVFSAAAIFGHTTHLNLQGLRGFLIFSLLGMIIVSVIGIFIPWNNTFEMFFAGFGVVIFSAYTMYDIQKLKSYPENEYIDAALQLYLDIFNLFVFILRLIMAFNSRD